MVVYPCRPYLNIWRRSNNETILRFNCVIPPFKVLLCSQEQWRDDPCMVVSKAKACVSEFKISNFLKLFPQRDVPVLYCMLRLEEKGFTEHVDDFKSLTFSIRKYNENLERETYCVFNCLEYPIFRNCCKCHDRG